MKKDTRRVHKRRSKNIKNKPKNKSAKFVSANKSRKRGGGLLNSIVGTSNSIAARIPGTSQNQQKKAQDAALVTQKKESERKAKEESESKAKKLKDDKQATQKTKKQNTQNKQKLATLRVKIGEYCAQYIGDNYLGLCVPIRHNGKLGEKEREVIEEKKENSVNAIDKAASNHEEEKPIKKFEYIDLPSIDKEAMIENCFLMFKTYRIDNIPADLLIDDTKLKSLVNYCFLRLLFIHYCCHLGSYVALFNYSNVEPSKQQSSQSDVLEIMYPNPETKPVFLFNLYSEPTFVNLDHRINCDKSFIKDMKVSTPPVEVENSDFFYKNEIYDYEKDFIEKVHRPIFNATETTENHNSFYNHIRYIVAEFINKPDNLQTIQENLDKTTADIDYVSLEIREAEESARLKKKKEDEAAEIKRIADEEQNKYDKGMEEYFEKKSIVVASENIEEKRTLYEIKKKEDSEEDSRNYKKKSRIQEESKKQDDLKAGMYSDMDTALGSWFTSGNGPSLKDEKFKNIIQKYRDLGLNESILNTAHFYHDTGNEMTSRFWKFGFFQQKR